MSTTQTAKSEASTPRINNIGKLEEKIYEKIKNANENHKKKCKLDRPDVFVKQDKDNLMPEEIKLFNKLLENGYKLKFYPKFELLDIRSPRGIGTYEIYW